MLNASATRRFHRLSPALVAGATSLVMILCFSATITPARAVDPTSDPSPSADPGPLTSPPPPVDPAVSPDPSTAPTPDPSPAVDPSSEPSPAPSVGPDPSLGPDPSVGPSPAPPPQLPAELRADHVWIDTIDLRSGLNIAGALDAAASDLERGRIYVVRFQVVNGTDTSIELQPVIEFGSGSAPDAWVIVPAEDPVRDVAFYTSANVRRGEEAGTTIVQVEDLRLATSADAAGLATVGRNHAGVNPGASVTLPAHAFTELAFTIRATAAADWLTTFTVRISNGDTALAGAGLATLVTGPRPPVKLSPGQRSGIDVDPPVVYRSSGGASVGGPALGPLGPSTASSHGMYTLTTDACASCHTTHSAPGPMLLSRPAPQAGLCFTCHDGTPASNVKAQYTDLTVPANNPGTGSYFSHAATVASNHVSDQGGDEFGGVFNRHTACADCHQPHRADGSYAIETTQGWTASGALVGASGVSVANGAAGTAPVYTRTASAAFEYQLCIKCHSGYTTLNPQTGGPSTWALDKAVELNPNNLSYHPVEAPGKNQTAAMGVSLSGDPVYGTSPYKLWIFTPSSTIRCVSCHGDSRLGNPLSPPDAGARLAPHAVVNRGMLIENLRDRVLKGPSAAYQAADFALCFVCHAEYPFVDTSEDPLPDTNFPLHGTHTAGIASFSGPVGGTVDDDGAGRGNAICAECHFRTHGTTYAVDGQTPASRLVNFAPNVQPFQGSNPSYAGQLQWGSPTNTCTLTCHGVDHEAWSY